MDRYRTGRPVNVADLAADGTHRWPTLAATAQQRRATGRLKRGNRQFQDQTLGAMNLFTTENGTLSSSSDHSIARALAEVATVAILGQRALRRSGQVAEQLQAALNSRVVIKQAKGMLAQQGGFDLTAAFAALRTHVRRRNQRLSDGAREVVEGTLTLDAMGGSDTPRPRS